MNALLHWFTAPEWSQLVKTLLHSLWQGVLIAAVLALTLRRVVNPHWRYRLALLALVMIPASGVLTWAVLNSPNHPLPVPVVQPVPIQTAPTAAPSETTHTKLVVLSNHSPAPPPSPWTAWLAVLWIVGTGAMLGRAGLKLAGAERLRWSCQPLEHPPVNQLLAEARRAVGLARQIRVVVTEKLTSPAVVGVLVPTLILPLSLVTTLTPEQIRFILLHELAHIRRGDYFANLFQLFVEALLFFNPAVWWISHQVRREREACCDAVAIELSGAPADYARTLVHVAENILNPAPEAATAFGNEREPSSLADRVQRLLVPGYRPSLRLTWRAMVGAFVLGATLLVLSAEGTRVAVAQIAKSTQEREESSAPNQLEGTLSADSSLLDPDHFTNQFSLGEPKDTVTIGPQTPVNLRFFRTHELDGVLQKLHAMRFQLVVCSNKPLGELFRELSEQSEALDKDGVGFRFSVIPIRLRTLSATIEPPLTNASLLEILAAIQGVPQLRLNGVGTNGLVTLQTIASLAWKPPENVTRSIQTNSTELQISGLDGTSRVEYNLVDGNARITNGGIVRFADTTIRADSIQLDQKTGILIASGNVLMEGPGFTNNTTRAELNVYSNLPPARVSTERTNNTYTSEKRRALLNKLDQLRLEHVAFDALPLRNVVLALNDESRLRDPERRGINIIINPNTASPDLGPASDIGDIRVTINPPLTNVRLADALDAVVKCASRPIKLSIEEYAVVISLKGQETTPLFMREFQLEPVEFANHLAEKGYSFDDSANATSATPKTPAIRSFFADAGIDLQPTNGTAIFYHDRKGMLLVRATMEELDQVEQLLQPFRPRTSPANGSAPPQTNSPSLLLRTFKIDPNTFWPALESAAPGAAFKTNVQGAVRTFFTTLGVDLNPPKSVLFNDRSGELLVRSTSGDLDVIEAALQVLNKSAPQVNLKVRFVEIDLAKAKSGNTLFLGSIPLDQIPTSKTVEKTAPQVSSSGSGAENPPSQFTGILSDAQYRVVLQALEHQKGAAVLALQEVTTLSGRQAQVQTVELRTVVNGLDLPFLPLPGNTSTNSSTNSPYQTQVMPFGPVLDVIPTVAADGHTIQMTVIPTVTEFLGYDDPGKVLPSPKAGSKGNTVLPLPRMRIRQMTTNAKVWDGQTLVLGVANDQLITKKASGGFLRKENPEVKKKQMLVFITPTIVDPAGNRTGISATNKSGVDEAFNTSSNLFPIIDKLLY